MVQVCLSFSHNMENPKFNSKEYYVPHKILFFIKAINF